MGIITLTSDWGIKDFYVASVKGSLLSLDPTIMLVDISHHIPAGEFIQAALTLRYCYKNFPSRTVHIVEVKAHYGEKVTHLAAEIEGQFFICPDNGILSLINPDISIKCVEIVADPQQTTFPARDIYVKAAVHLARGGKLEDLGNLRTGIVEKKLLHPVVEESSIRGSVIYIDQYGNLLTNIDRQLFNKHRNKRDYSIFMRSFEYEIKRLSTSYSDVPESEKLALFNSNDLLEIAIHNGKASTLLGMSYNDPIRIDFHDNQNR